MPENQQPKQGHRDTRYTIDDLHDRRVDPGMEESHKRRLGEPPKRRTRYHARHDEGRVEAA